MIAYLGGPLPQQLLPPIMMSGLVLLFVGYLLLVVGLRTATRVAVHLAARLSRGSNMDPAAVGQWARALGELASAALTTALAIIAWVIVAAILLLIGALVVDIVRTWLRDW